MYDFRTRALFVEFSLYNTNTDLLAIFSFLLEFPVSERTESSIDIKTCSLQTLQHGLDLPLFLTVIFNCFLSTVQSCGSLWQDRGFPRCGRGDL